MHNPECVVLKVDVTNRRLIKKSHNLGFDVLKVVVENIHRIFEHDRNLWVLGFKSCCEHPRFVKN